VTITLASAANLHLELNKLQEATGEPFVNARKAVKLSAYWLIALFACAFILVLAKPILGGGESLQAGMNSVAIVIVAFNVSVLFDLTRTVFKIPALERGDDDDAS
jgi:hypothetical protein